MLAPVTGDNALHTLTVENCGEDFLFALAAAIQPTEDLEVIESEAHGSSTGMVINGSSDDKRAVAATNRPFFRKENPFTSKNVKADLSGSKTRKANSTCESICDNFSTGDSGIEMLDEMDNHSTDPAIVQRKTLSRNPEPQLRGSANSEDASILPDAGEEKLLQLTMWF